MSFFIQREEHSRGDRPSSRDRRTSGLCDCFKLTVNWASGTVGFSELDHSLASQQTIGLLVPKLDLGTSEDRLSTRSQETGRGIDALKLPVVGHVSFAFISER